jgi:hypothetical protein
MIPIMNYMSQHLHEAIEINQMRSPRYAKLSDNRSRKISRALILTERLSLLTSYPLDNIAKYWQKRKVPVMVHEFIPMEKTPVFKDCFDDTNGITENFIAFDTKNAQSDLLTFFKKRDYKSLSQLCNQFIDELSEMPKHHCMVRHILESVRRASHLLPRHIEKAKELEVKSPRAFCHYLLYNQIIIINNSALFDRWAHPLQKDGIPILYQDVPYIPEFPENYDIY